MLRHGFDLSCSHCGKGTILLVGRAGRVVSLGGVPAAVPSDFMVPTCDECGAERWDAETLRDLESAIEAARLFALRTAQTDEMDPIPD